MVHDVCPAWVRNNQPFDGPKYLALAHALAAGIESGELSSGDRLPSHRELAEMFGVTIATITKAVAEASRRGLVVARKGSGTYVQIPSARIPATSTIELGLNTLPSTLVSDLIVGTLSRVAASEGSDRLLGYASYQIDGEGLTLARNWLSARGVAFPSGHSVFPCGGVQQGLIAAIAALARPGQTVLCEALTYTGILRACALRGAVVHGVELDGEGVVPDSLDRAFVETGARLFVCTPSTQNPTGRSMSEERRRRIAAVLRKHDAFLVEDAVNVPLSGGEAPPIASHVPERAILLGGFSKCAAPGLRFALASVPVSAQSAFHDELVATSWIAPQLHGALASEMVRSGAMDEALRRHRAEAAARQRIAGECLGSDVEEQSCPAYHVWIELPARWEINSLVTLAAAHNLRVTTSAHFACPNVTPPNALRICLGAEEDRATLKDGLQRLGLLMRQTVPLSDPVI